MIMGLFVLPLVPVLLRDAGPLTALPGERWEPKPPPARVRGTRLAQADIGPALPVAFLPTLSY